MFLKRIELHGFKSFADKTVLEFKPGVTLVVGPNGSGKSNVADAIRWVLGEQSAKSLRGGKMEDVIFAGSDKRKSLGMAEVSLTIDNHAGDFPLEFEEITVTRRLYRSGESDYLINKVPCRLKDIHEMFMDTGIGREGFSMIGQGRVEEILLARPEERRSILEDAAGIIKYRYRKKEAMKKLDETNQHLLRIEDLLLELREQEGPLSRQAEEARIYQIQKQELDTLEVGLIAEEIRVAREKLEGIQQTLSEQRLALEGQRSSLLMRQSQEESLRLDMETLAQEISRLQEAIYEASLKIEKIQGESRSELQKKESLLLQAQGIAADEAKLQAEWQDLNLAWEGRLEGEAELAGQLQETRRRLEAQNQLHQEGEIQSRALRESLATEEEQLFELVQQESTLRNDKVRYEETLASMSRQEAKLKEDQEAADKALENARAQEREAVEGLEETLLAIEEGRQNLTALAEELLQAKEAWRLQQEQVRHLASQRSQSLSRYKVLEEMEREGQGYAQGVKEILTQRQTSWHEGILGTVAQNIKVDKDYELAVEIALGQAAQNIISATEKHAQEAMRWLKSKDKGRVTFLPLDTLQVRMPPTEGLPKGTGVIGRMVDLIDFEDRYLPVMQFLLGRIWLVDQLPNAVARARETGFRYRLVTLDGQVVNAGGSLTGGSSKSFGGGFISRLRQLETLDGEIRQFSKEIVAGEVQEKVLLGALESLQSRERELQTFLQKMNIDKATLESHLSFARQSLQRLEKENETMRWQRTDTEAETVRLTGLLSDIQIQTYRLQEQHQELEEKIRKMKETQQEYEHRHVERQRELTEYRIQVAASEEKLRAYESQGTYLKNRMNQIQDTICAQRENKDLCEKRADEHQKTAQEKELEIGTIQKEILGLEQEKQQSQTTRLNLQEKLADVDDRQKQLTEALVQIENQVRQMEIQEGRLLANLEEWGSRLQEQHGLVWQEVLDTIPAIEERKKAQQRIKALRESLASMPNVNLGAVEEYQKLLERLAFLDEQVEDLTAARANLEEVIDHMDRIVAQRFKETFDEINLQFNEVFKRLFAGGRAHLYLTQPENLLESGVDIMAQPPGKKPQHLSLLSGGEKALTAIALLLAMLQVRPSPFSVLDEIESNLDEANVTRFAQLIKEYSLQGGQFIVITHRRGTMEVGDVIYGISAEASSGVSKVLSVRLDR